MEEKKKSKSKFKQPQSSPPLTVDQMLRLENVVKHKTPPKELQSLKSSNSFAFPTAASDLKLEKIIHKIDRGEGIAAWNISEQKVIRGLPIREFVRLRRDGVAVESPTLPLPPPEPPEWADLIYHPTMSSGLVRPMMRRINGRRVGVSQHGIDCIACGTLECKSCDDTIHTSLLQRFFDTRPQCVLVRGCRLNLFGRGGRHPSTSPGLCCAEAERSAGR